MCGVTTRLTPMSKQPVAKRCNAAYNMSVVALLRSTQLLSPAGDALAGCQGLRSCFDLPCLQSCQQCQEYQSSSSIGAQGSRSPSLGVYILAKGKVTTEKTKGCAPAGSEGAGVFAAIQVLLLLITWLRDFSAGIAFFLSEAERPSLLVGCINSK